MARLPAHPAIKRSHKHPPEWRMNPVTGEWVIMAPERAARPMMPEAPPGPAAPMEEPCPFCAGNESQTPSELAAFRPGQSPRDTPGWRVRTVPNSFAAVKPYGNPHPTSDGLYRRADGIGRHELFVECPQHEPNLARLDQEQVRDVARMWLLRLKDASKDPNVRYAQIFKNHGGDAGASVEHAHSQMIATPMIPLTVQDEMRFGLEFYGNHGGCCYCVLAEREQREQVRAVAAVPGFRAFTAYAGRQPFETWIVPEAHDSHLDAIAEADIDRMAALLWTVLRKLHQALDGPAYNLVFHTAPFHESALPYYHWHIEVLPRLTQLAGYEWGTGSHINPVLPEDAAVVLREVPG